MNKIYRLVWNVATGQWTPASELSKARGKRASIGVLLLAALIGSADATEVSIVPAQDSSGASSTTEENRYLRPFEAFEAPYPQATQIRSRSVVRGLGKSSAEYYFDFNPGADEFLYMPSADGAGALAVGSRTEANGIGAIAFGSTNTAATGAAAIAMGQSAQALRDDAIAIGFTAVAGQRNAVALGSRATASGDMTVALGRRATANLPNSVALGAESTTSAANSVAIGNSSLKRRVMFMAEGQEASDAVTMSQLGKTNEAVAENGSQLASHSQKLSAHEDAILRVGSAATALRKDVDNHGIQLTGYGQALTVHMDAINGLNKDTAKLRTDVDLHTKQIEALGEASGESPYISVMTAKTVAAAATDEGALALGNDAHASGMGSVALGSGSRATEANVVSVGDAAKKTTRRIINVADGVNDEDAVTMSQLGVAKKAIAEHEETLVNEVKPTLVAHGNAIEELRTADVGLKHVFSHLYADGSAAAKAMTEGDLAIGAGAAADSSTTEKKMAATAIGVDSSAEGSGVALGAGTKASVGSTALGVNANAAGYATVVGLDATALGYAVAIGQNASADVYSTAIGLQASAGRDSVVIGTDASALEASTAIGRNAVAGNQSLAIGVNANAAGNYSLALGNMASAQGIQAFALGWKSNASAAATLAVGASSEASQERAVALGLEAKAAHRNSVALGAKSLTDAENTVSVGSATMNRRITFVGDGLIQVGSKDAVNGGQLATVRDTLNARINGIDQRIAGVETRGLPAAYASLAAPEASSPVDNGAAAAEAPVKDVVAPPEPAQIHNVVAGEAPTDAVNVAQMNAQHDEAIRSANGYTDTRVDGLRSEFDGLRTEFEGLRSEVDSRFQQVDRRIDRMAATSGAYAGMAMNTAGLGGINRVGVGVGSQRGQKAIAVGYQRVIGQRASFSIGGATSGTDRSVNAGAGFSW